MSVSLLPPGSSNVQSAEIAATTAALFLFLYTAGGGKVPAFDGYLAVERKTPDGNWQECGLYLSNVQPSIILPAGSGLYRVNRPSLSASLGVALEPESSGSVGA